MPPTKRATGSFRTTALLAFSFVLILASLSAIVDITMKGATPVPYGKAGKTDKAVDLELNDLAGLRVQLRNYRGKNILINLWATWCIPCRAEMPDLLAYYRAHRSPDLEILAIDIQDEKDKAQIFVREQGMFFPVMYDPEGQALAVFGADGLPSTFVVDKSGMVRFAWTGQMTPALLEQRVTPWLAQ
jgi:peroxiredoxin